MELHVEIGVFHPVRPVQSTRDLHEAGAEQGLPVQASLEAGDDILEADEASGSRGGVINTHTAHMLWRIGLLQVDECGVQNAQLFHSLPALTAL